MAVGVVRGPVTVARGCGEHWACAHHNKGSSADGAPCPRCAGNRNHRAGSRPSLGGRGPARVAPRDEL